MKKIIANLADAKRVQRMYARGLRLADIAAHFRCNERAISHGMRRFGLPRRTGRFEVGFRGKLAHNWKGDKAGYASFHTRLYRQRGRASRCENNRFHKPPYQWANQTGNYADINDYRELCASCHRRYDQVRCGFPPPPSQRRRDITTAMVRKLWKQGLSKTQIARHLKISRGPVEIRLKESDLWLPGRVRWKSCRRNGTSKTAAQ